MSNSKHNEIDIQQLPSKLATILGESQDFCVAHKIPMVSLDIITLMIFKKDEVQAEIGAMFNINVQKDVAPMLEREMIQKFSTPYPVTVENVSFDKNTAIVLTKILFEVSFDSNTNVQYMDILGEIKFVEGTAMHFIIDRMEKSDKSAGRAARELFKSTTEKKEDMDEELKELFEKYTTDFTQLARDSKLDPVIGRDVEIHELSEILARKKKNNIALLGKPGTGKTAIAEGLALAIANETCPDVLLDKTVMSVNPADMLAGTKYRGEFEERCKKLFDAIADMGNVILFIDEAHTVMGAGASAQGGLDLSNMMKPKLARGELTCIFATTDEEYRQTIQKDGAMVRRLQRYTIEEPSDEFMIQIIDGLVPVYANYHGVTYPENIANKVLNFGRRYMQTKANPDKSIDIIDQVGAYCRVNDIAVVGVAEIMKVVSKLSNVPVDAMSESEGNNFVGLNDRIKEVVFNQDSVIDDMVEELIISKAGLKEPNKPMASFLSVGVSGTGKTEAARQLAKQLHVPLIKFDMSEYQESHSVSKLIGAPPGYVGYDENSAKLIDEISDHPNCVLLLDEIEKAHPKVLSVLLQVMDDAILTSSSGKVAKFENVIIIMTSNLGASTAGSTSIGFGSQIKGSSEIKAAVEKFLPPEFINRLNNIFTFNTLDNDTMRKIVLKETTKLNTMLEDRGVKVEMTDDAITWLATNGYDVKMGARPLERLFSEKVKKEVSKRLVLQGIPPDTTLTIDVADDQIVFEEPISMVDSTLELV